MMKWLFRFIVYLLMLGVFQHSLMAQNDLKEKHVEITLRTIGHQILLNSGDTSSRVLPVKKQNGQYFISFENEVGLQPEITTFTIDSIMNETRICSGYMVEIKNCEDSLAVHSYEQFSLRVPNTPPCLGRDLQIGCYFIALTLLNEKEVEVIDVNNQSQNKANEHLKTLPTSP